MTLSHVFTVDVEDWPQSTLNHSLPIGDRVVVNTRSLLELMAEAKVRGTFFVLGRVAEAHPSIAREIAAAGHELGTHGYSHESVEAMPVTRFRDELHRSIDILRQQTGHKILGHRAADFSISHRSLHLLEYLGEEGIEYDSSIFPVRHPRYGVPGAWRYPHRILCASGRSVIEFPLATLRFGGMDLPVAGGGYLRLFPYWWTHRALRRFEREEFPATCYVHPYELDTSEMKAIPYPVPRFLRWGQSTNRRSVRRKLQRLFSTFRFATMGEAHKALRAEDLATGLDLSKSKAVYAPRSTGVGAAVDMKRNSGAGASSEISG